MTNSTSICSMGRINENDRAAARRVKQLWFEYKKKNKVSQERAAQQIGMSQGSFSQYINGSVPMSIAVLARFCGFFNVKPWDIRQEFRNTDLEETNQRLAEALVSVEDVLKLTEDYLRNVKDSDSYILNRVQRCLSDLTASESPDSVQAIISSEEELESAARADSLKQAESSAMSEGNSSVRMSGAAAAG